MRDATLRRLAAGSATFAVGCDVAGAVFAVMTDDPIKTYSAIMTALFPIVGLIIVRSQTRNGVGWVFVASGVLQSLNTLGDRLGAMAFDRGWPYWVGHVALYLTVTWFPALFLLITLGLLYFPSGRLPGRSWRWLERITIGLMFVWQIPAAIVAWPVPADELEDSGAPHTSGFGKVLFDIASSTIGLILPCVIGSIVSVFLRWRRGTSLERQQIRWVAAAGVVTIVGEAAIDLLPSAGLHFSSDAQSLIETTVFTLIAISTGVAITRYRLYEIDRIVSRTLAYAAVTVLLGATYVGIVALGATVIPASYGSVGVAVATLSVAALFVPLRRRVQTVVDRRFNRSRYDAAHTVDAFTARIRGDITQADLSAELLRTVQTSIAPASASVWLFSS